MEFRPFNALLKIAFSEHQLIEIKMVFVYKMSEIKRLDTTAVT